MDSGSSPHFDLLSSPASPQIVPGHILILFQELDLHHLEPIRLLIHLLVVQILLLLEPRLLLFDLGLQRFVLAELLVHQLGAFEVVRIELAVQRFDLRSELRQTVLEVN